MGSKKKQPSAFGEELVASIVRGMTTSPSAPPQPVHPAFAPSVPVEKLAPSQAAPRQGNDPRYAILKNPDLPEARWDVSGAFIYRDTFFQIADFFAAIGLRLLSCVHDAPLCLWNSGRVNLKLVSEQPIILQALEGYSQRRLPVHLTFSNSVLTSEHLADPNGNIMLRMLADFNPTGENGVIVCSELLAAHVRRNLPSLKLISSVVKIAHEEGKGKLDYYRQLEKRYDKIMVHPDDNFNLELLSQLEDKDRYEILVNEPCIRDCKVRKNHYQLLSKLSTNMLDSSVHIKETELRRHNDCQNAESLLFDPQRRTLVLSPRELKQLYDLGFRNFKIQGRGMVNDNAITYELFRLALNHHPDQAHLTARVIQRYYCGI